MAGLAGVVVLILVAGWLAAAYNKRRWRKLNKMFCYFEYEYNGEIGTSRDYGPMKEIDAIGAMGYRQQLGAVITFEKYSSDIEEIHELIDLRHFMHDKAKQRGKYK